MRKSDMGNKPSICGTIFLCHNKSEFQLETLSIIYLLLFLYINKIRHGLILEVVMLQRK